MNGPGRLRVVLGGSLAGLVLAITASMALAATSTKPTLTVKVVPIVVKPHQTNKVYLTVTYDKKTTQTRPYLAAYVQFSAHACRSTAKAEGHLSGAISDWSGQVTNSPFTRWDSWHIGTLTGTRRVCAYLYASKRDPTPLLTGTATYRVV